MDKVAIESKMNDVGKSAIDGKMNDVEGSAIDNDMSDSTKKVSAQKLLEEFYSRQKEWWSDSTFRDIACIVMIWVPVLFFWLMPATECLGKDFVSIYIMLELLICSGLEFYRSKYGTIEVNKKNIEISKILQYMPISKREIDIFVLKKVATRCIKLTIVGVIIQCAEYAIFYHQIEWIAIAVPVVALFVIPVILVGRVHRLVIN